MFIELDLFDDGSNKPSYPILFNTNQISSVITSGDADYPTTFVTLFGIDETYEVCQSYEQILTAIQNHTKVLRLPYPKGSYK